MTYFQTDESHSTDEDTFNLTGQLVPNLALTDSFRNQTVVDLSMALTWHKPANGYT